MEQITQSHVQSPVSIDEAMDSLTLYPTTSQLCPMLESSSILSTLNPERISLSLPLDSFSTPSQTLVGEPVTNSQIQSKISTNKAKGHLTLNPTTSSSLLLLESSSESYPSLSSTSLSLFIPTDFLEQPAYEGPDHLSALPGEIFIKIIARIRMRNFLAISHVSRSFRALFKDHAAAIHNTAVRTRFPGHARFLQCEQLEGWGWLVPKLPLILKLEADLEKFMRKRLVSNDPSVTRQDLQSFEFDFKLSTPGPQLLYMLELGVVIDRREGRGFRIEEVGWYGWEMGYGGSASIGRHFSKKKLEERNDAMIAYHNANAHAATVAHANSNPGFLFQTPTWHQAYMPVGAPVNAPYQHPAMFTSPIPSPTVALPPAQPFNLAQAFNPWLPAWQNLLPTDSSRYETYTWDKDCLDTSLSDDEYGLSDIIMGNCLQRLSDLKYETLRNGNSNNPDEFIECSSGEINYSRPKQLTWYHGVPDWFVSKPHDSIWEKWPPKLSAEEEAWARMRKSIFAATHPIHWVETKSEYYHRLDAWKDLYSWFPSTQE